jgi:hypothetical protein
MVIALSRSVGTGEYAVPEDEHQAPPGRIETG